MVQTMLTTTVLLGSSYASVCAWRRGGGCNFCSRASLHSAIYAVDFGGCQVLRGDHKPWRCWNFSSWHELLWPYPRCHKVASSSVKMQSLELQFEIGLRLKLVMDTYKSTRINNCRHIATYHIYISEIIT